MNGMMELNPDDMINVSGGGPNINAILLKLKKAVMKNKGLFRFYKKLDAEMNGGDCTDNVLLEEIIWGRMGIPMKYDYANDRILFGGFDGYGVWTLDQVLGRLRTTGLDA